MTEPTAQAEIDFAGFDPTPGYDVHGEHAGERDPALVAALAANEGIWPRLRFEVKADIGPGGGWPAVLVSGPRDDMRRFLVDWHDGDEDEVRAIYGL